MDVTSLGIVGGFVGWAGYMFAAIRRLQATGPIVSTAVGAAGAVIGGALVAPLLADTEGPAGPFVIASAVAGALVLLLAVQPLWRAWRR